MTIALASARPRTSANYVLAGALPRNAAWVQVLEIPNLNGTTADITGNDDVQFIFRESIDDTSSVLIASVTGGDIVVTDGNTLTISAGDLTALTEDLYYVDLVSIDNSVTTLWASGVVVIDNSLSS